MAKTALHYIINRPKGEISVPSAEFASRAESEGQFAIKGKREVIKVTSMHRVVKLRVQTSITHYSIFHHCHFPTMKNRVSQRI